MGTETTNRAGAGKTEFPLITLPGKQGTKRFGMNFNKASGGFRPDEIENFQRGIFRRDFVAVEKALEAGVPVETPVGGMHPLYVLLHDITSGGMPVRNTSFPEGMSEEQYSAQTTRLVDLVLSRGIDLNNTETHREEYAASLVDTLLYSTRTADLSTVIIEAMFQKLEKTKGEFTYETDLQDYVEGFCDRTEQREGDAFDLVGAISAALYRFKGLHEVVRLRLQNPESVAETGLVYKYADDIEGWTDEFVAPPIKLFMAEMGLGNNNDNDEDSPSTGVNGKPSAKEKYASEMEQMVIKLEKKTPERVLAEMGDEFVGMEKQKRSYGRLAFMQAFNAGRKMFELSEAGSNHSTVYLGPPGVGKTTVARKKAELLHALGLVGPNYVEITREKLVGAYIGHTEEKWLALLKSADVIFIDEAYALFDGRSDSPDFGKHIINALLTVLENDPTKTIFLAGYKGKMEDFLNANEGLRSRISNFEIIDPMDKQAIGKVIDHMERKFQLKLDADAKAYLAEELEKAREKLGPEFFGNAREVRKVMKKLPEEMAARLFDKQPAEGTILLVEGGGEGAAGGFDKDAFMRVLKEDLVNLDLPMLLGSKESGQQKRGIGFMAKI